LLSRLHRVRIHAPSSPSPFQHGKGLLIPLRSALIYDGLPLPLFLLSMLGKRASFPLLLTSSIGAESPIFFFPPTRNESRIAVRFSYSSPPVVGGFFSHLLPLSSHPQEVSFVGFPGHSPWNDECPFSPSSVSFRPSRSSVGLTLSDKLPFALVFPKIFFSFSVAIRKTRAPLSLPLTDNS